MKILPRKRRVSGSSDEEREAIARLVRRPLFELIPLRNALARAEALPAGAATTVTASPSHGIEATVDLCEALIARGHEATPHLAAHMFRDRAHVAELLDRCRSAGIRSAFVVGGDAKDRGEIHDGSGADPADAKTLGHPFTHDRRARLPGGSPDDPEPRAHARPCGRSRSTRTTSRPRWGSIRTPSPHGSHGCATKASRFPCTSGFPGRRRWGSSRPSAPGSAWQVRCGICGNTGACSVTSCEAIVRTRRAPRGPRADAGRSHRRCPEAAPLHVQPGRGDRGVAAAAAGGAQLTRVAANRSIT